MYHSCRPLDINDTILALIYLVLLTCMFDIISYVFVNQTKLLKNKG